jgi:hypothetical protein
MQRRTAVVVLAVVQLASVALGYTDVRVKFVSPRTIEEPGLIAMQVMLTNLGDGVALPQRLDVLIKPFGYGDYRENIPIGVGESQAVTLFPWVYGGDTETCMAYITYPEDMNHHNDTDVVIVNSAGVSDRAEMEPGAGMNLTLSPSPLTGNTLHVGYSLNRAGPVNVTLFDIAGRPVATRRFVADRAGELPLDLRSLSAGVYLVRLDDGHRSVMQKLVVQR